MSIRGLPLAALLIAGCSTPTSTVATTGLAERQVCDSVATFTAGRPATTVQERSDLAQDFLRTCGMKETEALTADLVRFATVSATESPADGPAFVAMAKYLEAWSAARGFSFESVGENHVWIVAAGEGKREIAFVMHADVVPVRDEEAPAQPQAELPPGWSVPPFEMTARSDRLYGRGTEDDKGPIAAVLVMMHTLKRFGLLPKGRVEAIMGTGEEHDWDPMIAFAKSREHAPYVISLDANYPVVVAESGFVAWPLSFPRGSQRNEGCTMPIEVSAGQFLTQVPGEGRLVLEAAPQLLAKVEAAAAAAGAEAKDPRFGFEARAEGGQVVLQVRGAAVHSSVAPDGANAMWHLASIASRLDLCPSAIRDALTVVQSFFANDHWAGKLGIAYEHPLMGRLLVAPTVLRTEDAQVLLRVNMRRPEGRSVSAFHASLDAARGRLKAAVPRLEEPKKGRYVGKPALVDPNTPLVTTLLDIYRTAAEQPDAQPMSIRGGTYARLFPGAVSFGPALPGRPYRGHAPDEYIERDALQFVLKTTMQAVLRLTPPAEP